MPKKRHGRWCEKPLFPKPTAKQALKFLEEKYLCEWGDASHMLTGYEMRDAYLVAHIGLGNCTNPHNSWRKWFWEKWREHTKQEVAQKG